MATARTEDGSARRIWLKYDGYATCTATSLEEPRSALDASLSLQTTLGGEVPNPDALSLPQSANFPENPYA